MRDRIKDLIRVALMIGICTGGISITLRFTGKASHSNYPTAPPPTDTVLVPVFHKQPAKDGLKAALIHYEVKFPEIVYAQAVLETGHFKSVGCLRHHNLFGLYNSEAKRYHRFNHWTESVVAYREWVQKRYKPPEDYYMFLQRIGYAEDPRYVHKLKQIVNSNDKRGSLEGGEGNS